jgi:hypothetical protein
VIETRPRGRPSRGDDAKKSSLAIRTTRSFKARLAQAATESGRSLAHEIEVRLDESFKHGGPLPAEHNAKFLRQTSAALATVEQENGKAWVSDHQTFVMAEACITRLLERRDPGYPPEELLIAVAVRKALDRAFSAYELNLRNYREKHVDCPRPPDAERKAWLEIDQKYQDAINQGRRVADQLDPPPMRHPGHVNDDGTVTPVANLRR